MHCRKCLELHKDIESYQIVNAPTTGRASKKGLCCKHDRELFGVQSPEEQGEKQRRIASRKARYRLGIQTNNQPK